MDRIIYTAANGAMRTLEHQAALTNNMANSSTPGFRAQMAAYRSVPVVGQTGQDTRVLTAATTGINKLEQGALQQTGKPLDVAIDGQGWLAVQGLDGQEAYTRAGSLQVNSQNQLITTSGFPVLSADGQIIEVPERAQLSFNSLGELVALGAGDRPGDIQTVAQIKLVNPSPETIIRGGDGLFRSITASGQIQQIQPDETVRIVSGAIESSNVNPAETMVGMIENARRFEMQMKIISDASANEQRANSILSAPQ